MKNPLSKEQNEDTLEKYQIEKLKCEIRQMNNHTNLVPIKYLAQGLAAGIVLIGALFFLYQPVLDSRQAILAKESKLNSLELKAVELENRIRTSELEKEAKRLNEEKQALENKKKELETRLIQISDESAEVIGSLKTEITKLRGEAINLQKLNTSFNDTLKDTTVGGDISISKMVTLSGTINAINQSYVSISNIDLKNAKISDELSDTDLKDIKIPDGWPNIKKTNQSYIDIGETRIE